MTFGSIDGIGTLEDWEEFLRYAHRKLHLLRVQAYEGEDWALAPELTNEF